MKVRNRAGEKSDILETWTSVKNTEFVLDLYSRVYFASKNQMCTSFENTKLLNFVFYVLLHYKKSDTIKTLQVQNSRLWSNTETTSK